MIFIKRNYDMNEGKTPKKKKLTVTTKSNFKLIEITTNKHGVAAP